jgi:glyoxylase-like metal-dependent hydrolase (beta-lactamase superfamily II)
VTDLTRRNMLAGASLAAASAVAPAQAAAPAIGKQAPSIYRYRVGDMELTAIYDGVWYRPIDEKFIRKANYADVQRAMSDAFMPAEKLATPFTMLLVNTGKKLILLDTGTGGQVASTAGAFGQNLIAAGIDPKTIDQIVISHFHPDHINGIKTKDNDLIFPNAEIMVPAAEWAFWSDDANMRAAPDGLKIVFHNVRRIFNDIAKDVTHYQPGKVVAPGVETVAAPGHTPGHTVFAIQSGKDAMMVLSDTTQHPALFARNPEWEPQFDIDGAAAVTTRKKLLDRVAADRMLVTGYHFPFPACGHIVKTTTGYEHVPLLWNTGV